MAQSNGYHGQKKASREIVKDPRPLEDRGPKVQVSLGKKKLMGWILTKTRQSLMQHRLSFALSFM